MHPLRYFADGRLTLPVIAEHTLVFPVHSKTGQAIGRKGSRAHYVKEVAGVVVKGRIRYGARWLCTGGSADAVLLPEVHEIRRCTQCEEKFRPAVYRCFSATDRLLYIGSSAWRTERLKHHAKHASWWPQVADVRFEDFASIDEARQAEWRAIGLEGPAFNMVGPAGSLLAPHRLTT